MSKECINKTHLYDYTVKTRKEKLDENEVLLEYIECKRCGSIRVISINTKPENFEVNKGKNE